MRGLYYIRQGRRCNDGGLGATLQIWHASRRIKGRFHIHMNFFDASGAAMADLRRDADDSCWARYWVSSSSSRFGVWSSAVRARIMRQRGAGIAVAGGRRGACRAA